VARPISTCVSLRGSLLPLLARNSTSETMNSIGSWLA
jgi:hypothetical protein